jgi:hypothetical protein
VTRGLVRATEKSWGAWWIVPATNCGMLEGDGHLSDGFNRNLKGNKMNELNVNVNANIDFDSIITIGIARAERDMNTQVKNKRDQITALNVDLANHKASFKALCERNFPAHLVQAAKDAQVALAQFGVNVEIVVDFSAKMAELSLLVNRSTLARSKADFKELDVVEAYDAILEIEAEIEKLQFEVLDLRKRLSNISSLERSIRGQVAEAKLKAMGEEGIEMLNMVLNNLDENIKALPGL